MLHANLLDELVPNASLEIQSAKPALQDNAQRKQEVEELLQAVVALRGVAGGLAGEYLQGD